MKIKRHRLTSEIPTSSMADIAFLLIIFFMLTFIVASSSGLELNQPKDDQPPKKVNQEQVLYLVVDEKDNLYINSRLSSIDEVDASIVNFNQSHEEFVISLRGMKSCSYGMMVTIFSLVTKHKSNKIRVSLDILE